MAVMIIAGAGLAFAEFEFEFGFYGGLGNAAAAGLNLQLGYITPAYKGVAGGEKNPFRWALLTDLSVGYRYGSEEMRKEFPYTYSPSPNQTITTAVGYEPSVLDYTLGLITEFYFLPFLGIAVGGGVTPGLNESWFTPYIRAQVPFLFNNVKLGFGFDYILWKNNELPQGITPPPGYRVNLFINFRGELAANVFLWWLRLY